MARTGQLTLSLKNWLGNFTLSVRLGGAHIQGSPFSVRVVPLKQRTLYSMIYLMNSKK